MITLLKDNWDKVKIALQVLGVIVALGGGLFAFGTWTSEITTGIDNMTASVTKLAASVERHQNMPGIHEDLKTQVESVKGDISGTRLAVSALQELWKQSEEYDARAMVRFYEQEKVRVMDLDRRLTSIERRLTSIENRRF